MDWVRRFYGMTEAAGEGSVTGFDKGRPLAFRLFDEDDGPKATGP
jgi:hypothetical protein